MTYSSLQRVLPVELEPLAPLALDLRWTWSHAGDALWRTIDARTWELTGNPWFLLQNAPQRRLAELALDAPFVASVQRLAQERQAYLHAGTWCGSAGAHLANEPIAFFCMEFGLGEAIPLYAGGLGILAGDYLKTASDLGLPVLGVGTLFQEGYFRQSIDVLGQQSETYPYNDPSTLPVQPVHSPEGGWLRVAVELPGRMLWLRVWRANVGRTDLYLLDANEPINHPVDRGITAKLYGGDLETRLLQDIVLGIGGLRALKALGVEPSVIHLNEGHSAFAVLERTRALMESRRLSFGEGLWASRGGSVFTTHTPMAVAFDTFPPELLMRFFPERGSYMSQLSISQHELLALGRGDAHNESEPFNMAYLALRGCAHANGVSKVHERVSRSLFSVLHPRRPTAEVPIDHITNGVHVPSWDSQSADALWTEACGKSRWAGTVETLGSVIERLSDQDLWRMRNAERSTLLAYARQRLGAQLERRGIEPVPPNGLGDHVLTISMARRFTEYKRPHLLLRDTARLTRLLTDETRPVQLILAGKAHPADEKGKGTIAAWLAFVNRPEVRHRALFLEDYDMSLAARLVTGVDVWINTPRLPWEACGTSGMKVLVNGGLNLSALDGWWAEAYAPELGWKIGERDQASDDERDADELCRVLEQQVVPEFYDRDAAGLPRRWLSRVRRSMARLTPQYSCNRMLLEYAQRCYTKAAASYRRRTHDAGALARALAAWEATLQQSFERVRLAPKTARVAADSITFEVEVDLATLQPELVRVELYAEPLGELPPLCIEMSYVRRTPSECHLYAASVQTARVPADFTPRVVPYHEEARVPAECSLIAWAERGSAWMAADGRPFSQGPL